MLIRHLSSDTSDLITRWRSTPDGRHALSGSADRTLRLWDLATGQLLPYSRAGTRGDVTAVAVTPDGRHALSGSAGPHPQALGS